MYPKLPLVDGAATGALLMHVLHPLKMLVLILHYSNHQMAVPFLDCSLHIPLRDHHQMKMEGHQHLELKHNLLLYLLTITH